MGRTVNISRKRHELLGHLANLLSVNKASLANEALDIAFPIFIEKLKAKQEVESKQEAWINGQAKAVAPYITKDGPFISQEDAINKYKLTSAQLWRWREDGLKIYPHSQYDVDEIERRIKEDV
jgi:hypothetical protein